MVCFTVIVVSMILSGNSKNLAELGSSVGIVKELGRVILTALTATAAIANASSRMMITSACMAELLWVGVDLSNVTLDREYCIVVPTVAEAAVSRLGEYQLTACPSLL